MLIRRAPRFTASEITDPKLYLSRRELMLGAAAALALGPGQGEAGTPQGQPLSATRNAALSLAEPPTKIEHATTYNNFYEFGVNKDDPSRLGGTLRRAHGQFRSTGWLLAPYRTIKQLLALERRTSAAGQDSIDHPKHGHDDVINAAAGALLLVHAASKSSAASVASFTTSTRDIAGAYLERRSQRAGGEGIVVRNRWGQLERYYDPRGE